MKKKLLIFSVLAIFGLTFSTPVYAVEVPVTFNITSPEEPVVNQDSGELAPTIPDMSGNVKNEDGMSTKSNVFLAISMIALCALVFTVFLNRATKDTNRYVVTLEGSNATPETANGRRYGYPLRCVAR